MINPEKGLNIFMKILGISMMFALPFVVVPESVMVEITVWLGFDELPEHVIVQYLARTLSLFYFMNGLLFFYISFDCTKYLSLIRFFGYCFLFLTLAVVLINLFIGMPLWWTLGEGLSLLLPGLIISFLVAEINRLQVDDREFST